MGKRSLRQSLRGTVQVAVFLAVLPVLPMWVSGDWEWWQAWAVAAMLAASFVVSRVAMARLHPGLLEERLKGTEQPGTKPWDKVLAPLVAVGSAAVLIIAGLDRLHQWTSEFSSRWQALGFVMLLVGYAFSTWASIANAFFSGTVRIQVERGHRVVTDGPYRIVRHPGYSGLLLGSLGMPLALNSLWASIPAALLVVVTVTRCALEDRALRAELPGYAEYTQHTRYRLLPGIW